MSQQHNAGHLLCLGFGYVAQHLAAQLPAGWQVAGTARTTERLGAISAAGAQPLLWPGDHIEPVLAAASHVVSSVAPRTATGGGVEDPVLTLLEAMPSLPRLRWLALLSTTGVYGDHGGGWVDETTAVVPASHRGGLRAAQEARWSALAQDRGLPLHIFRLAGIYGPGRSAFDRLRDGTARRIVKPGQVFSRAHVEDIAAILSASMARPRPGAVYNVADDLPGPPQDVIAEAARLLDLPIPPEIPFHEAEMTPMARSFYADNKRVSNVLVKRELGIALRHPDFHAGLRAILAAGG